MSMVQNTLLRIAYDIVVQFPIHRKRAYRTGDISTGHRLLRNLDYSSGVICPSIIPTSQRHSKE